MKIQLDDKCFNIYNAYGPSVENERYSFFALLVDTFSKWHDPNVYQVVAGDFNIVANNGLDIISGNSHSARGVCEFNNAMLSMNVYDVWRLFHPGEKEYTWCKHNPFTARRLDYILCDSITFINTVGCDIATLPDTDHMAIIMEIQLTDIKRGPSYWKFNDQLLKDSDYVEQTNQYISTLTEAYEGLDHQVVWDLIKIGIREMTISYSKQKAQQNKNIITNLRKDLDKTAQQLSIDPDDKKL